MMAVWRKWEVEIIDGRGERHYADFETKAAAMAFAKAMQRHGIKDIVCSKNGLISGICFQIKPEGNE
jgi:hypothetical protein